MAFIHGAAVGAGLAAGAAYEMAKRKGEGPQKRKTRNGVEETITSILPDGTKRITELMGSGHSRTRIVKLNKLEKVRYQGGEIIKEKVEDLQEGARQFVDDKLESLQSFTGTMSERVKGFFSKTEGQEDLPEEAQEALLSVANEASLETEELGVEMDGEMPEDLSSISFESGATDIDDNKEE